MHDTEHPLAHPAGTARPGPEATPLRHIRAIAFDLDNTLVDIMRVKERAAEAAAWALADAGLDVHPEKCARAIMDTAFEVGFDRTDVVDRFMALKHPDADVRLVHVGRHAFARAEDDAAVPYPRAHRTLLELSRRGFTLAVVTDATRDRAVNRLQAARLLPFFKTLVTLDDTDEGKVDAAPYRIVAERLGLAPHEILMVGDNPARDIVCARTHGLRAVLAEYGLQDHLSDGHESCGADARIPWLDHLLTLVPAEAPKTPVARKPQVVDGR